MTTRNTRIVTKMFNQEVKTMAKNCSNESNKNRSGASNTKNTSAILRAAPGKACRCPLPGKCLLMQARQSPAGCIAQKAVPADLKASAGAAFSA